MLFLLLLFVVASRIRHSRCSLVTGVQTCALPFCLRNSPSSANSATAAPNSRWSTWWAKAAMMSPQAALISVGLSILFHLSVALAPFLPPKPVLSGAGVASFRDFAFQGGLPAGYATQQRQAIRGEFRPAPCDMQIGRAHV